ncbi:MAG TPA: hypothetical protein VFI70_02220 [Nitrososphaeraceae archaeon]|nr:hypothetical protein [Nitrososphaeraceae archaeon]
MDAGQVQQEKEEQNNKDKSGYKKYVWKNVAINVGINKARYCNILNRIVLPLEIGCYGTNG